MRNGRTSLVVGLAMVMSLLTALPTTARQATPASLDDAPVGVLAEVEVDALPSTWLDTTATPPMELPPAAEVWFLRLTLAPDGFLPMDRQIGPTVLMVESGMLALDTDAPVELSGSGAEPVIDAGGSVVSQVETGQSAYVREGTMLAIRNDGDAPVTFLALLVFSPYAEVLAMEEGGPAEEPRGVLRQQPLGVTTAEFPEGPGVITIERVVLEAGASETLDLPGGGVVAGIEQGSVTLAAASGMCYLWPGMLQQPTEGETGTTAEEVQPPQRDEIAAGETADLNEGDAAGCHNGMFTWTAGDAGATVIRASVVPLGAEGATPTS